MFLRIKLIMSVLHVFSDIINYLISSHYLELATLPPYPTIIHCINTFITCQWNQTCKKVLHK